MRNGCCSACARTRRARASICALAGELPVKGMIGQHSSHCRGVGRQKMRPHTQCLMLCDCDSLPIRSLKRHAAHFESVGRARRCAAAAAALNVLHWQDPPLQLPLPRPTHYTQPLGRSLPAACVQRYHRLTAICCRPPSRVANAAALGGHGCMRCFQSRAPRLPGTQSARARAEFRSIRHAAGPCCARVVPASGRLLWPTLAPPLGHARPLGVESRPFARM